MNLRAWAMPVLLVSACSKGDATAPVVVPCANDSPSTVAACVDTARYREELEFVAKKDRATGGEHWQAVQDRCRSRLEAAGFDVALHTYESGVGVNVVGTLRGTSRADEHVVLSAHYDAVSPECTGADDNASGLAGILEAARVLGNNRYERTLVVACWDEHEIGLVGSRAWVADRVADNTNVVASFVFEMIGFRSSETGSQATGALDIAFPTAKVVLQRNQFRADFVAVIHNSLAVAEADHVSRYAKTLGLVNVPLLVPQADVDNKIYFDLTRSDHKPFWLSDLPGVMITDTGPLRNPNYHCGRGDDALATLDPEFAADIVRATTASVTQTLGLTGPR